MSNNKYLLGMIMVAFFVLGMSLPTLQTNGKFNGFAAYAQTGSKMTQDSEKLLMDPQFRQQVIDTMKKNHDIAQNIIMEMINDPALRLQLLWHLTENKDVMQDLTKLFGQNGTSMKTDSAMMDHSSMSMKKDTMKMDTKKDTTKSGSGTMDHSSMSMKKDTMKMDTKKDTTKSGSGTMDHGSMSMKKDAMKKGTSASVDFSNVKITNISSNSVTIQGNTNHAVNCQVEYWTAKDPKHYFASDTGDMMDMKHTDHKVTIKNLMPNAKYSYKFKATLDSKTFYSSPQTFTTKAA